MPDKLISDLELEAADTVAYYVKDELTLRGFFCRKRKKCGDSSFAIQVAEIKGMPEPLDETN